ncbi:MAG: hypothetical protein KDB61_09885, partial [Planctomycetes bacterium]|nr:hypothetical protein [Planctomycetota bacterium]
MARRVRWHARLGEALILGVAAVFVLLSLALKSGAQGLEWHALAPSFVGGLAVAVLWLVETHQSEFDWACKVDRRLGLNGRLLAGLSVERGSGRNAMGELLIEGLRAKVSRSELLRHAVPVSLWLIVLPFVGGSLLMQGLGDQRGQVVRWAQSAPQFRALQDRLGEAAQRARELGAEASLVQELGAMQDSARRGGMEMKLGQGDREYWSQELADLATGLERVGSELGSDREWNRALDGAQSLVEALRDRVGIEPERTATS